MKKLPIDKDIEKLTNQFIEEKNVIPFPHKYGFIIALYEKRFTDKFYYPNIDVKTTFKDKDMCSEKKMYKKKNILNVNDKFITECKMGNTCYCVDIIKVLEKHN